jgi:3-hydroxyisobutyrate dehydrogenase
MESGNGHLNILCHLLMSSINNKSYEPCPSTSVAFLGLGVMGFPWPATWPALDTPLLFTTRSPAKSQAWLAEFGSTGTVHMAVHQTPALAAQHADVVFCCVGNDDDLRSVTLGAVGAFAGMKAGAVFVDHTTASASVARELAAAARQAGLESIDAPVSGGQGGAQNGMLSVMCGGDAATFAKVQPVGMAFSRAFTLLGDSGAGQLAKMVNQICIAGLVQGLSEGDCLWSARRAGYEPGAGRDRQGCGTKLATRQPRQDHGGRPIRLRLCRGLDAQRPGPSAGGGQAQRCAATGYRPVDQFYADVQQMGGRRWDTSSLIKRLK